MDYQEQLNNLKIYVNINKFKRGKYASIVESLPEFSKWVEPNKAKLKRNILKATFLTLVVNGKNYDLIFTQDIGRRFKRSTGEWIERRNNHFIAVIENVPVNEIYKKYDWIMGR